MTVAHLKDEKKYKFRSISQEGTKNRTDKIYQNLNQGGSQDTQNEGTDVSSSVREGTQIEQVTSYDLKRLSAFKLKSLRE